MTTQLNPVAQEVFDRRYSWNGETADGMLRRVAKHVAGAEQPETREAWEGKFYDLLTSLRFLPNSPTLFNAGTNRGLLSACFLFVVDDSLESIMECHRLSGLVQKYGGGVGYALSRVRPQGELIRSVQGKACGPVALLPYYNGVAQLITQGGKRAGAQMGILSAHHPDVEQFITAKDIDPDKLSTFNISVALTDDIMEQYLQGDPAARKLLRKMAESAHRTGDPGTFFVDRANADNPTPWLGRLEGTNPCGEVPLLHGEACNLGSLDLGKYVNETRTGFDMDLMTQDVKTAVRFLDNVVSTNNFPDQVIIDAVSKTRKIGLGVMGWADALALLEIHYDTPQAITLAHALFLVIQETADKESELIGAEKGIAPAFEGRDVYYRNATRTCIAPTGSIAILAGCSSGIEPHYRLEYTRTMYDRGEPVELRMREGVMEKLEKAGSSFRPRTAMEIDPSWHIRHQSAFQEHVNLAVSKTINCPEETTVEQIEEMFVTMWRMGCKGGTVYRDNSRAEQVLGEHTVGKHCPTCGSKLIYQEGCLHCEQNCGYSRCEL